MTPFFNTSLGKTVKVALWLAGSYLAAWLLTFVGHHTFTGVYAVLPAVINIAVYAFNTIKDVEVPTLPSSPLMKVVPLVEEAIEEEQPSTGQPALQPPVDTPPAPTV